MKINLNFDLTDLDGKPLVPRTPDDVVNCGKVVANALVQTAKGDPLKHHEWAVKLWKGEELDLDKSDTHYLKKFVEDHQGLTHTVKAPVIEKLMAKD